MKHLAVCLLMFSSGFGLLVFVIHAFWNDRVGIDLGWKMAFKFVFQVVCVTAGIALLVIGGVGSVVAAVELLP